MTDNVVMIQAFHNYANATFMAYLDHNGIYCLNKHNGRTVLKFPNVTQLIDSIFTTSQKRLELIEWNPIDAYEDEETGELIGSLPASPGPVMLLLKDGSIELDEYCVDEAFDEKTGETYFTHQFGINWLGIEDVEAWAEVPRGYKFNNGDKS